MRPLEEEAVMRQEQYKDSKGDVERGSHRDKLASQIGPLGTMP